MMTIKCRFCKQELACMESVFLTHFLEDHMDIILALINGCIIHQED